MRHACWFVVALMTVAPQGAVYFGEAHNDYLELAAGGGLLVGVPIAACLFVFVRDVRRRMRDEPGSDAWWLRRGAVTALLAIALQEVVDFSLQMPGNAVLFAAVCAIALHESPERPPDAAKEIPFHGHGRIVHTGQH